MAKLLFFFVTVTAIYLTCIDGLIQLNEQYYISESKETFIHALSDCKLVGMDLARLENGSVQASLVNILTTAGASQADLFWLGGVHRNGDSWVWVESGHYFNYTNWGPSEPQYGTAAEHCLQLGMDYGPNNTNTPWQWEAQSCAVERYYICQRKEQYYL